MSKNKPIGIFDSGLGGLTVLKAVHELCPNEDIIYFGDTANLPYGTKSEKQIIQFAKKDAEFLMQFDIKALMIACNTADSVASQILKDSLDVPVFGVITPASKQAIEVTENQKIGVLATSATIASNAYTKTMKHLNPEVEIYPLACPLLVPLVENGRFQVEDSVVRQVLEEYLEMILPNQMDTIVLGCTHYPLLYDAIHSLVPKIHLVSSSTASAEAMRQGLEEFNLCKESGEGSITYYVSDQAEEFASHAKIFLGKEFQGKVEQVHLE